MPVWITSRFGVLSDKNGGFRRADAGMSGDFISGFRRDWEGFYSDFFVDRIWAVAQFVG